MTEFTEVYENYYDRVHRFLHSLCGNAGMADELTQEVFYRALIHINQYNEQGNMFTWLCTIGKNEWLNECRKQKRLVRMEEEQFDHVPDAGGGNTGQVCDDVM